LESRNDNENQKINKRGLSSEFDRDSSRSRLNKKARKKDKEVIRVVKEMKKIRVKMMSGR